MASCDWSKVNYKAPVKQETSLFLGLVIWSGRITNSAGRGSWNVIMVPLLVSVEELRESFALQLENIQNMNKKNI